MTYEIIDGVTVSDIIGYLLICLIVYLILRRMTKIARQHLAMKNFVKKSIRLDRKKFDGNSLVDKIKRRRKRHTNSFQYLRGGAKRLVRRYFNHKSEELPVIARYANGGLFKRSNNKIVFYVKQGKKTLNKYTLKKGAKFFVDLTNQYNCVDELIVFLHQLPDAVLEKKIIDIYSTIGDVTLTYQIK